MAAAPPETGYWESPRSTFLVCFAENDFAGIKACPMLELMMDAAWARAVLIRGLQWLPAYPWQPWGRHTCLPMNKTSKEHSLHPGHQCTGIHGSAC